MLILASASKSRKKLLENSQIELYFGSRMTKIDFKKVVIDLPIYGYSNSFRTTVRNKVGGIISKKISGRNKNIYIAPIKVS